MATWWWRVPYAICSGRRYTSFPPAIPRTAATRKRQRCIVWQEQPLNQLGQVCLARVGDEDCAWNGLLFGHLDQAHPVQLAQLLKHGRELYGIYQQSRRKVFHRDTGWVPCSPQS